MLSMLEGILDASPTTSVWLFYQVRNSKQEAFGQRLRELSKKFSQFRLFIYHSQPDREGMHLGKVQAGKLKMQDVQAELGSIRPQFYMCGPDAWMHACVDQLQQIGYPQDHIHYESFGSETSIAPSKSTSATSQTGYEVRFTQTQTQVRCSDQESLLDAALAAKPMSSRDADRETVVPVSQSYSKEKSPTEISRIAMSMMSISRYAWPSLAVKSRSRRNLFTLFQNCTSPTYNAWSKI